MSKARSIRSCPGRSSSAVSGIIVFTHSMPSFCPMCRHSLTAKTCLLSRGGRHVFSCNRCHPGSCTGCGLLTSVPRSGDRVGHSTTSLHNFVRVAPVGKLTCGVSLGVSCGGGAGRGCAGPACNANSVDNNDMDGCGCHAANVAFGGIVGCRRAFGSMRSVHIVTNRRCCRCGASGFNKDHDGIVVSKFCRPSTTSSLNSFNKGDSRCGLLDFFKDTRCSCGRGCFLSTSIHSSNSSHFRPSRH